MLLASYAMAATAVAVDRRRSAIFPARQRPAQPVRWASLFGTTTSAVARVRPTGARTTRLPADSRTLRRGRAPDPAP